MTEYLTAQTPIPEVMAIKENDDSSATNFRLQFK